MDPSGFPSVPGGQQVQGPAEADDEPQVSCTGLQILSQLPCQGGPCSSPSQQTQLPAELVLAALPSLGGNGLWLPPLCEPVLCEPPLCEPALSEPALCDAPLSDPALSEPALSEPSLEPRLEPPLES